MLTFKKYLLEYLTDEQREKYSKTKMLIKARKNTDHFFGKDNDIVHGQLNNDSDHLHHKSEIHKAVEQHLGKEISTNEYKSGLTKDKYGRDVKLGRVIKDEKLRNNYASDATREGAKKGSTFTTSTVRGIEVAGQTNSSPNKEHPKGHSWGDLSCKNVDTGSYKHYLKDEIKHGTVVHRVHDHTGQEIYRATLQPYHNDKGHVAYALNSEYGIKHPTFTKSAHETANKLSGEYKPGLFHIHDKVYNDDAIETIHHPNSTPEHISKALNDRDEYVREAAIKHPKATSEHITKALNDEDWRVRKSAIEHPNSTPENISKALNDKYDYVKEAAIKHPNATSEHISKALNDKNWVVRTAAIKHPNVTPEHISKALNDKHKYVRETALKRKISLR
jgi:hypothetical protein